MKKLIDEGAVRTLKKPAQMKKSLLTTASPMFYRKEDFGELHHHANYEIGIHDKSDEDRKHVTREEDHDTSHNYSDSIKSNSSFDTISYIAAVNKRDNIAYLLMANSMKNGTC